MSPAYKPKKSFINSFRYALHGIGVAWKTQRNLKTHVCIGILAILLGVKLNISKMDWYILSISIILVWVSEMINSAIELTVDIATKKRVFRAMLAKDIAAGAVLLTSIHAIIIGYFIFFERLRIFILGVN